MHAHLVVSGGSSETSMYSGRPISLISLMVWISLDVRHSCGKENNIPHVDVKYTKTIRNYK